MQADQAGYCFTAIILLLTRQTRIKVFFFYILFKITAYFKMFLFALASFSRRKSFEMSPLLAPTGHRE